MRVHNERGVVILMAAMSILSSLLVIGAVGMGRSTTELLATNRYIGKLQAFHAAESAIDEALTVLRSSPAPALPYTCPDLPGLPMGMVRCTVTVQADGTLRVSGTGSAQQAIERVEAIVEVEPSAFRRAAFGASGVDLDDVLVDSYDSALGAYDAIVAPADANYGALNRSRPVPWVNSWEGSLQTNGTGWWAIHLKDTTVFGTVTLGPGALDSEAYCAEGNTIVYGGLPQQASSPVPMDPITVPPGLCTGQNLTNSTVLDAGAYCYTRIALTHNKTVQTNGPVTIYVTDEFAISDGAALIGQDGPTSDPSALTIKYLGTSEATVNDTAQFTGTLYAPNAALDMDDAELFGAVMAKSVMAKDSRFHYDVRLSQAGLGNGSPRLILRSWRQLGAQEP